MPTAHHIYTKDIALTPRIVFRTRTRNTAFAAASALFLAGLGCGPGAVGSVGAVLSRDTHTGALHVHEAPDGLASANAGILPGDQVKMIDGVLVDDLDSRRIKAMLRGPVGSTVTLTVVRGDDVLHMALARQAMGNKPAVAERHERIE